MLDYNNFTTKWWALFTGYLFQGRRESRFMSDGNWWVQNKNLSKQKYQNYFYMLYANYLTYIIPKSISESGIHKTAMDLWKPWIIILITKSCKTARKDIFLVAWLKLVVSILNSIQYLGKVGLWYRSNPWEKWANRAKVLLCIQTESSVLAMTGCISGTGHQERRITRNVLKNKRLVVRKFRRVNRNEFSKKNLPI